MSNILKSDSYFISKTKIILFQKLDFEKVLESKSTF